MFAILKDNKAPEFQFDLAGSTGDYDTALEIADRVNNSELKNLNKTAGKVGGNREDVWIVDREDLKGYDLTKK